MFKKVTISNFKCLRDVTVELGPFNVLIGLNNTGKTSFLEAVQFGAHVGAGLGKPFQGACFEDLAWQGDSGLEIQVLSQLAPPLGAQLNVDRMGALWRKGRAPQAIVWKTEPGEPVPMPLLQPLASNVKVYRFLPNALRKTANLTDSLQPDGSGLATVLSQLQALRRERFEKLQERLRQAIDVPGIEHLSLPQTDQGLTVAVKERTSDNLIYGATMSDGLLFFLAYLGLVYSQEGGGLLMIEEPEWGIHVHRLEMIVKLLREASQGIDDIPPTQVILTTHSPHLLDWCEPEEVLFFKRLENGEVKVRWLSDVPGIEAALEEEPLGDLVYAVSQQL